MPTPRIWASSKRFCGLSTESLQKNKVPAFNKQVDNELTALFGFLARHGSEVGGRAASQPGEEVEEQLLRFARGECNAKERAEACEILRQNSAWHRWMVNQIKPGQSVRSSVESLPA